MDLQNKTTQNLSDELHGIEADFAALRLRLDNANTLARRAQLVCGDTAGLAGPAINLLADASQAIATAELAAKRAHFKLARVGERMDLGVICPKIAQAETAPVAKCA